MDVTQWIKESCEQQNATTPEDFIGMTRAYDYLVKSGGNIGIFNWHPMIRLYRFVKNDDTIDIRTTPVYFAEGGTPPTHWQHIHEQLDILFEAVANYRVTPEEFYQRFEEIHPCVDGNGRVGALIYNWMRKTLTYPVHPPAFDQKLSS